MPERLRCLSAREGSPADEFAISSLCCHPRCGFRTPRRAVPPSSSWRPLITIWSVCHECRRFHDAVVSMTAELRDAPPVEAPGRVPTPGAGERATAGSQVAVAPQAAFRAADGRCRGGRAVRTGAEHHQAVRSGEATAAGRGRRRSRRSRRPSSNSLPRFGGPRVCRARWCPVLAYTGSVEPLDLPGAVRLSGSGTDVTISRTGGFRNAGRIGFLTAISVLKRSHKGVT